MIRFGIPPPIWNLVLWCSSKFSFSLQFLYDTSSWEVDSRRSGAEAVFLPVLLIIDVNPSWALSSVPTYNCLMVTLPLVPGVWCAVVCGPSNIHTVYVDTLTQSVVDSGVLLIHLINISLSSVITKQWTWVILLIMWTVIIYKQLPYLSVSVCV